MTVEALAAAAKEADGTGTVNKQENKNTEKVAIFFCIKIHSFMSYSRE